MNKFHGKKYTVKVVNQSMPTEKMKLFNNSKIQYNSKPEKMKAYVFLFIIINN